MHPHELLDHIIRPTLKQLDENTPEHRNRFGSPAAQQLLLATAAQESRCGEYVQQIKGPAVGIYQMEPDTIQDLYDNYLKHRINLLPAYYRFQISGLGVNFQLHSNMAFATALARLQYFRFPEPLPELNDRQGMWLYYKTWWNTAEGAATEAQFSDNWFYFGIDKLFNRPN